LDLSYAPSKMAALNGRKKLLVFGNFVNRNGDHNSLKVTVKNWLMSNRAPLIQVC